MSGVFPFGDLTEFERFRGIALEDPTTARSILQLREGGASRSLVRVYYGPPGTGKTLAAVQKAVEVADPAFANLDDPRACFEHLATALDQQVSFVTFHQALQYEDMVEAIRPALDTDESEEPGSLGYQLHAGPLMRMIRRAIDHPDEEHVLVIDEINRGDISRILGPLISSIEPDKRLGGDYPIGFDSQYPRAGEDSRVFVPSNLHLIGTMNSADRNIALVDYALRRRFEFVEVPPEPALLDPTAGSPSIDLEMLLATINRRVAYLLDRDHEIGHGYLIACETNEEAVERFARRILPLLSEYFYGNESALLLVLGDRIGGEHNLHEIEHSDTSFEEVFGQGLDAALELGYRSQQAQLSIKLDPRFWDPTKVPPGPRDLGYAVQALRAIYEPAQAPVPTPGAAE